MEIELLRRVWQMSAVSPAALGLVDGPAHRPFDALTRVAQALFDVPVALISIVEEHNDRQFFTSEIGLPEPWAQMRQTPLSHSFCQHVKRDGTPLVVRDARRDPRVSDNRAVPDLGVIAYLGVPVFNPNDVPIGALCVIDDTPRDWSEDDIARLGDVARCVSDEIQLRAHVLHRDRVMQQVQFAHDRLSGLVQWKEALTQAVFSSGLSMEARLAEVLGVCRRKLGFAWSGLALVDGDHAKLLVAASAGQVSGQVTGQVPGQANGPLGGKAHRPGDWVQRPGMRAREVVHHGRLLSGIGAEDQCDLKGAGVRDYVGLPVRAGGRVCAVIELTGPDPRHATLGEDDVTALGFVALIAGALLELGAASGQVPGLQRRTDGADDPLVQALLQQGDPGASRLF